MRRFCGALLITTIALLAMAGTAVAALPAGALSQLPFPGGCFAYAEIGGCSTAVGLVQHPINIAATADGAQVYVLGSSGALKAFNRDGATGVLSTGPGQAAIVGTHQADGLAIDAAGTRVAVAGGSPGGGRVSVFTRAGDGTLTLLACAEDDASLGCPERDGLSQASGVALPPSGPGVYVASASAGGDGDDAGSDGDGALAAFHAQFNGVSTTLVQDACIPAVPSPVSGNACENPPTLTTALQGVTDVAVSPDGATVYAGGNRGIAGFARDPSSGELAARVACIKRIEGLSGCGDDARMGVTRDIALDPAGESLYVAANDRLVVFDRQPLSGGLTLVQCLKEGGGNGCVDVPALSGGISSAAVSPDGRTVYVTSALNNLVLSLRRDPATGLLTALGCVSFAADPGCSPAAGLNAATAIATSPGGRAYVASNTGTGPGEFGAVASFRAAQTPVCQNAAVTVVAGATASLPLACSDGDGDPLTLSIASPAAAGALGAIDQAARSVAYTAPAAAGAQSVSFGASDGVNSAAAATVAITVTAASGPPPPAAGAAAAPRSRIAKIAARIKQSKLKRLSGTATGAVSRVELSLVRLQGGARIAVARCQLLSSKGTLRSIKPTKKTKRCTASGYLRAKGTTTWSLTLKKPLPKGSYVLTSRALGAGTLRETKFSATLGNRRTFKVI